MAEITYTHHQTGEDGTIVWHGQRFYPNRPVETDNAELIGAATGHPHFEVSADEPDADVGEAVEITFLGEADGPVEWRGVLFPPGTAVPVRDKGLIAAARGNPLFEVADEGSPSPTGRAEEAVPPAGEQVPAVAIGDVPPADGPATPEKPPEDEVFPRTGENPPAGQVSRSPDPGSGTDALDAPEPTQADALEIEAQAKRRLADEYDAAQERGEVAGRGGERSGREHSPAAPTADDIGLTRKAIHEAQQIRDAEAADPGDTKGAADPGQPKRSRAEKQAAVRALLGEPLTDREIARRVGVSPSTVAAMRRAGT